MAGVIVELFGTARTIVGAREVEIEAETGATVRTVISTLGERVPDLLGRVIAPDGAGLVESYGASINGKNFTSDLDVPVQPGDRLLLLFVSAGG